MRILVAASVLVLGLNAAAAAGSNPKDCLDLSASQDQDVSSPSGIRVTVAGRNHCSDSVNSGSVWFTVKAMDGGNTVVGSQGGRFGPVLAPGGQAETKVFVVCDPEKVAFVRVE